MPTCFFIGHRTAQAVRNVKKRHPEVTLTRLLAYYRTDRPDELSPGFGTSLRLPHRLRPGLSRQHTGDRESGSRP